MATSSARQPGSGRSGVQLSVVPRPFALVSRGHTRAAGWGKKERWGEREERGRGTKHTRERKEAADWGDRGQIERSRHFERSPPLYVWQRAFLMVKQRRLSSLFFTCFFCFCSLAAGRVGSSSRREMLQHALPLPLLPGGSFRSLCGVRVRERVSVSSRSERKSVVA